MGQPPLKELYLIEQFYRGENSMHFMKKEDVSSSSDFLRDAVERTHK